MTITHSMSWPQINQALRPFGYYVVSKDMTILKDCRLVSRATSKQSLINYFRDLL